MMAGLFLIMSASIASIYFRQRIAGIILLLVGLLLCVLMLWHHATDTLGVMW